MRRWFIVLAAVLAVAAWDSRVSRAGIIFSDSFDSGASPLWGNEVGSWTAGGGVYNASVPSNFPSAYSSLPFELADFSLDFDTSRVHDAGVWLRSAAAPGTSVGRTGILLVTGGRAGTGTGLYWHIVTDGNSYGAIFNEVTGLFTPGVNDAHIRIEATGDTYKAFLNGSATPTTTLTTSAFASGRVALFDNSSLQSFDNVVLSAVPEPSSLVSAVLGLAVLAGHAASRRRPGNRA